MRPQPRGDATPLDLVDVPRARLAVENARARTRAALALQTSIGFADASITPSRAAPPWTGAWSRIDFACAGRPGSLHVPIDLVRYLVARQLADLDWDALQPDEAALVLEAVERALLSRIAEGARTDLVLTRLTETETPDGEDALPISLTFAGAEPLPALLRCHPIERERVIRAFASQPLERRPFPGLTVRAAFRCGYSVLPFHDYAKLEEGGGIVLDDTTLGFQKIQVVVAERFVQTCTWQTVRPVLDGSLLKRAEPSTALYCASGLVSDHLDPPGVGPVTAKLDEVPVHLVFELGRVELAIADLETLDTGYVFDLGKPLTQSVDIIANGRRVGSGALVRLGEAIGVQVRSLLR
jgi:type III secretion protein Q